MSFHENAGDARIRILNEQVLIRHGKEDAGALVLSREAMQTFSNQSTEWKDN